MERVRWEGQTLGRSLGGKAETEKKLEPNPEAPGELVGRAMVSDQKQDTCREAGACAQVPRRKSASRFLLDLLPAVQRGLGQTSAGNSVSEQTGLLS